MTENDITIKNVGPIDELTIAARPDGGVLVLRGPNGCGKSTALDAVHTLMTGKGKLPVRDTCKSGLITGYGVRITVARSTRHVGELEAIQLEDRLRIAQFVDPGVKSDDAADSRRIKALVGLTGAEPDPTLFPEDSRHGLYEIDDLVEQAAAAKRNLEGLARAEEKRADELQARARALREGVPDDELPVPDVEAIRATVAAAMREEVRVRERYDQAARRDVEAARAKLHRDGLVAEYDGPTVKDARRAEQEAVEVYSRIRGEVQAIETRLVVAKAALADANNEALLAEGILETARQHQEALKALQTTIDAAASAEPIDEEAVTAAEAAREAAEKQLTGALLAQEAEAKAIKAREVGQEAVLAAAKAATYREAAKSTDDVLADAIDCPVLRVEAGRLVTQTARGRTFFAELSQGERWRIALDIAADRVGEGGIFTVPQDAWEGLDAQNRSEVHLHARRRRVTILTAEAERESQPGVLRVEAVP